MFSTAIRFQQGFVLEDGADGVAEPRRPRGGAVRNRRAGDPNAGVGLLEAAGHRERVDVPQPLGPITTTVLRRGRGPSGMAATRLRPAVRTAASRVAVSRLVGQEHEQGAA
jgi:hypothetical protein